MRTCTLFLLPPYLFMAGCASVAASKDPAGLVICADYRTDRTCTGYSYTALFGFRHQGIDFAAPAGTVVVSATHGTLMNSGHDQCLGYYVTVETDLEGEAKGLRGKIWARYMHVEVEPGLLPGRRLKPGDPIGKIMRFTGTKCQGDIPHAHYELRVDDKWHYDVNPHSYWLNGPGEITCFQAGLRVPQGKAVAPLRCGQQIA